MKEASPKIVVKGSIQNCNEMTIVAKMMVLFTFQGRLAEAAVTFMTTNYVFMFQYPDSLSNFCLLQKCIVSINDGKKLPASVISFVNKLDTIAEDTVNWANDDSHC